MSNPRRSWLFAAIFWVLFAGSIGLSPRYRWLDAAWIIALLLYFAIASGYVLAEAYRTGDARNRIAYQRTMYRWWRSLVLDDEGRKGTLRVEDSSMGLEKNKS